MECWVKNLVIVLVPTSLFGREWAAIQSVQPLTTLVSAAHSAELLIAGSNNAFG
jgi:hypothetical protein